LWREAGNQAERVAGIGIAYQMHGLVALDAGGRVVHPAIIWCDSRAVETGARALEDLGAAYCLEHCLNSPGNFTASKLRWLQLHRPEVYAQIAQVMLPGDYIAFRMTGNFSTTVTGLSEGIWWDFRAHAPATRLLDYYDTDRSLIPPLVPIFGEQGRLTASASAFLGLKAGTPVTYRAGDQPNNALALNVLEPGACVANAGTSGVLYGVSDRAVGDAGHRVNSFAHVNHVQNRPRVGILLCINGTGIFHRWVRQEVLQSAWDYTRMEAEAAQVAAGADGLLVFPFGNGAERMLGNRRVGAQLLGIDLNRHRAPHLIRGGLEGIACAFAYGAGILETLGMPTSVVRAGQDNLFQSAIFAQTLSNLLQCRIELYSVNGAAGAGYGAGMGLGWWDAPALPDLSGVYEPRHSVAHLEMQERWNTALKKLLANL
jgi:xylulokinase